MCLVSVVYSYGSGAPAKSCANGTFSPVHGDHTQSTEPNPYTLSVNKQIGYANRYEVRITAPTETPFKGYMIREQEYKGTFHAFKNTPCSDTNAKAVATHNSSNPKTEAMVIYETDATEFTLDVAIVQDHGLDYWIESVTYPQQ